MKNKYFSIIIFTILILGFQNCGAPLSPKHEKASSENSKESLLNELGENENETGSETPEVPEPVTPEVPEPVPTVPLKQNLVAPEITSSPGSQVLYAGEGTLSGSTSVTGLEVEGHVGVGEENEGQVLTLICSSNNNAVTINCGNGFANGKATFSIQHNQNRPCVNETAEVTLRVEDSVPTNPDAEMFRSDPVSFDVTLINNCLGYSKKLPNVQNIQDNFGAGVSSDGTYTAVAAPGDDTVNTDAGAIHIYKKESGNWNFKQKITIPGSAAGEKIGPVSIASNRLIIGSPFSNSEVGRAYIYERSGETWSLVSTLNPNAPNSFGFDHYGAAVAILGDRALIGAPNDSANNKIAAGAVYAYRKSGATWVYDNKYIPQNIAPYSEFGSSLSMNGTRFVGGAPANYNGQLGPGKAYIYLQSGNSWAQEDSVAEVNGKNSSMFGFSLSLSGDWLVVGAPKGNGRRTSSGSAYTYKRNGSSWDFDKEIIHSDGAKDDRFGYSVSIDGVDLLVGSYRESANNMVRQGSAYHYKYSNSDWGQIYKVFARDREALDFFGVSLVVKNGEAIVGSLLDDGTQQSFKDGLGSIYFINLK